MRQGWQELRRLYRRLGPLRLMRYGAEALGAHAAYGIFSLLPAAAASALGGFIMRKLGPRFGRHHKTVLPQLAAAFPGMSAEEREAAAMAMWDNLGRVFAEYAHLDDIYGRVTVVGAAHLAAARDSASAPVVR
jgi:KDO2-lipid IV(A) lauroyltransferase